LNVKYIIVLIYQFSSPKITVDLEVLMTRLLTVDEVAKLTGWKASTIRQKTWRRELPYVKLGRSVRFREETITKLIEQSVVPALERQ
jgi:excisionase family DNA binding protein